MTIPMAASGQPAPVTLVEIQTKGYAPPAAPGSGPVFTPPAPPRALAPSESIAWVTAGAYDTFLPGGPGPVIGTARGTAFTASITMTAGDPLGQNTYGFQWSDYTLPPEILPGSVITDIIPVLEGSSTNGNWAYVGTTLLAQGAFSGTIYGTAVGALAGVRILAYLFNTLPGPASLVFDISFVGFAIIYKSGVAGGIDDEADRQLARGIFFWSEHKAKWPSILTGNIETFLPWITQPTQLQLYASTQTDTATVTVQNISGNTIERDAMKAFVRQELIGALCVIRLWRGDAEQSLRLFLGTVKEVQIGDTSMVLQIEGFGNYSAIDAPSYDIDVTCPLTFGSTACGSTSSTPCDQTFGNCSQKNRFAGVIAEWLTEVPNQQLAQPAPTNNFNPRRAF